MYSGNKNKLSLKYRSSDREKSPSDLYRKALRGNSENEGSLILSSNMKRRPLASSTHSGSWGAPGKEDYLESTRIPLPEEPDPMTSLMTEDLTAYFSAESSPEGWKENFPPTDPSIKEFSSNQENQEKTFKHLIFSGKKLRRSQIKAKGRILAEDSSSDEETPGLLLSNRRRRSSILGRHEVVLITSESDDEEAEFIDERQPIQRPPMNDKTKVENWLATSPIPQSPATPARIILSSSSSEDERDAEKPPTEKILDVVKKNLSDDLSDCTSKGFRDITPPDILGGLISNSSFFSSARSSNLTSKGITMETIREEEEDTTGEPKTFASTGVQVEIETTTDEEEETEDESPSRRSEEDDTSKAFLTDVSIQVDFNDTSEEDMSILKGMDRLSVLDRKSENQEDESSSVSADESSAKNTNSNSPEHSQSKKTYTSDNKTPSPVRKNYSEDDDSDTDFKAFLSSVRKKYLLSKKSEEEKSERWNRPLDDFLVEDDKDVTVYSDNSESEEKPTYSEKDAVPFKRRSPTPDPDYVMTSPIKPTIICLSSDEELPTPAPPPKPKLVLSNLSAVRSINQKKNESLDIIVNDEKSGQYLSFLASLTPDVTNDRRHPEAVKYIKRYNSLKVQLCHKLFALFNKEVFDELLPSDTEIEWNPRLRKTAGLCTQRRKYIGSNTLERSSKIGLSTKVLDSCDRLRDTLVHEMCHAASWVISGYRDGHGPIWKTWAKKAMTVFPELPIIDRCHNYHIRTKFTYKCEKCGYSVGRHSKSLDTSKKCCGYCHGRFVLLSSGSSSSDTPSKPPNAFANFVKENYKSFKTPDNNHSEVMKLLGNKYKCSK